MSCDVGEVTEVTSQFILQPFFRFYVTGSSLTSPGEPPMDIWIVRNKDEDKISGHSTVSLSQKWRRGSINAVNFIIEREGKHIFCFS